MGPDWFGGQTREGFAFAHVSVEVLHAVRMDLRALVLHKAVETCGNMKGKVKLQASFSYGYDRLPSLVDMLCTGNISYLILKVIFAEEFPCSGPMTNNCWMIVAVLVPAAFPIAVAVVTRARVKVMVLVGVERVSSS